MSRFSALISRTVSLRKRLPETQGEIYDSVAVRSRLNSFSRRRLSDRIEDVFYEACLTGDLDTAQDLLMVLERMQTHRQEKFGGQRRLSIEDISRARHELQRRLRQR